MNEDYREQNSCYYPNSSGFDQPQLPQDSVDPQRFLQALNKIQEELEEIKRDQRKKIEDMSIEEMMARSSNELHNDDPMLSPSEYNHLTLTLRPDDAREERSDESNERMFKIRGRMVVSKLSTYHDGGMLEKKVIHGTSEANDVIAKKVFCVALSCESY
ncbi:hypothetical protein Tco_0114830 [Tanacetum coccineum]